MTTFAHPNATVPDSVEVPRLGALQFELGFPTPETTQKLFDEMDFQRAVQAYLWAYPAVSFESIRVTSNEHLGIDLNDLGIADKFVDTRSVWLTANDTTIYAYVNMDVSRGPIVIGIPPGAIVGLLDDFWQRSLSDVGLPGPDAGNGGKFLLLPPDYDGEVPSSGYYVLRATMHNHNLLIRGIIVDNDVADAVARVKKAKIYPWSERDNPQPNKFVSISGALMDTTPPGGMEFWQRLATVIDNNPVQEHDRFYMAMLKPLGIEKGQTFKPDARQTAILEDAARLGDAMARNVMYEGAQRQTGVRAFPGTQWDWVFYVKPRQETEYYSELDERLMYTYGAIYLSPALGVMKAGPGTNYVQAFRDKNGDHFDGGKSYRLHVPANPPAAAFWSVTAYDSSTRSMLPNQTNDAAHSSYDKLEQNADGSFDMYFGPTAQPGQESNWVETVPGRGWYPMFRIYSPTEGMFDGTWALPDVQLI
ncbi:DUF1254 domain-containing protein [Georgenia yuyongxinii]|uniref:DUF1254 domain-containing protein n=1 Tax=Georgenia yuyongxinii TaxID=2589797 RepID=A0A552WS92_9MICO|nr:DUF1254 domain-containing protein [Georgenia yuyongxinii]TRW45700.1 DUF1254 domain-containing protein [Georgenia yuyongxinii]